MAYHKPLSELAQPFTLHYYETVVSLFGPTQHQIKFDANLKERLNKDALKFVVTNLVNRMPDSRDRREGDALYLVDRINLDFVRGDFFETSVNDGNMSLRVVWHRRNMVDLEALRQS